MFLAVLPFLIGALSLTVKGPKPGLGPADPLGLAPTQPQYIMVLPNIGAVFMGTALTIRDLIGERPIFKREQAVGLSTTAYLLAKVAVFCVFATVQAAIATFIVRLGKGAPTTADGQAVIPLTDASKAGTLYVATKGKPYPVEIIKRGSNGGQIAFADWNAPVSLAAPANAVDLTQLQSGG